MDQRLFSALAFFLAFSSSHAPVFAQESDFSTLRLANPNYSYQLLSPWNTARPASAPVSNLCFGGTIETVKAGPDPKMFNLDIDISKTRSETLDLLDISVRAEADALFGGMVASGRIFSELDFSESSINFLFYGNKRFRVSKASNFNLTKEGNDWLDLTKNKKDFDTFSEKCGPELINQIQEGVSVGLIYSYTVSDRSKIKAIESYLKVDFTVGEVSINSLSLSKKFNTQVSLQVRLYQTGEKFIKVSPFAVDTYEKAYSYVLDIFNSATKENSPVIRYSTAPISDVVEVYEAFPESSNDLFSDRRLINAEIGRLIDIKDWHTERYSLLNSISADRDSPRFVQKVVDNRLEKDLKALDQLKQDLQEAGRKCLSAKKWADCKNNVEITDLRTREYLRTFVKFEGWQIKDHYSYQGAHGTGFLHFAFRADYWPRVKFDHLEFVQSVEFIRDDLTIKTLKDRSLMEKISSHPDEYAQFWDSHYADGWACFTGNIACVLSYRNAKLGDYIGKLNQSHFKFRVNFSDNRSTVYDLPKFWYPL